MRMLRTAAAAVSTVAVLVVLAPAPASAVCGGPVIELSRASVRPGGTVRVLGQGFAATCNDMLLPGQDNPPPAEPSRGIRIDFVQGDRTVNLATVDADDEYRFSVEVTVPADARTGRAGIVAQSDSGPATADFTVTRRTAFARTGSRGSTAAAGVWLVVAGAVLVAVAGRPAGRVRGGMGRYDS